MLPIIAMRHIDERNLQLDKFIERRWKGLPLETQRKLNKDSFLSGMDMGAEWARQFYEDKIRTRRNRPGKWLKRG
jgi:hypothetical protein